MYTLGLQSNGGFLEMNNIFQLNYRNTYVLEKIILIQNRTLRCSLVVEDNNAYVAFIVYIDGAKTYVTNTIHGLNIYKRILVPIDSAHISSSGIILDGGIYYKKTNSFTRLFVDRWKYEFSSLHPWRGVWRFGGRTFGRRRTGRQF